VKTKSFIDHNEVGQVLPLVALMMVAIVGMVALIIDGGSLMSNKRAAQAAADAGALAGAKRLCLGESDASTVATKYANDNKGININVVVANDQTTKTVTVDNDVQNASFFANIFGSKTLTAHATATAGCYPPSGLKVLPIAWSCKYTKEGPSSSPDCMEKALDWNTQMKPLINGDHVEIDGTDYHITDFTKNTVPGYLYVFMDSMKTNIDTLYTCAIPTGSPNRLSPDHATNLQLQPTKIDCDLNWDGINDVLGQGDRSWLDLDGGLTCQSDSCITSNGASALKNWIKGIGVPTLSIHTWLGGQTGVATTIFKTVNTEVKGKVAIVPVFDGWCGVNPDNDTSIPGCIKTVHDAEYAIDPSLVGTDHEPIKTSPGAGEYFHIIGYSAFYVTCVDDGSGKNSCPGAVNLINENTKPGGLWASLGKNNIKIKSIEGYFVKNYPLDNAPGTGGVDMGLYIVSLSK
jgi:hypothetical protein